MTPESVRRARELMARPDIEAVSFDVFDTVLLRRCTAPDGVFERTLAHAPLSDGHRKLADSFVQHRTIAEYRARAKALKAGATEVTIGDIYRHFPAHVFGIDPSGRAGLADAEFAAELDLCFVNPEIATLAAEARTRGLKVGFVSDTYWDGPRLERLLRSRHPDLPIDFLYASCDHGFGKSFGLFKIVLESERLEAGRLLHIGDNLTADLHVPASLGINTVHYPQHPNWLAGAVRREETFVRSARLRRPEFSQRLDGGLRALRRMATSRLDGTGPALAAGAGVLGPVFMAFQRFVAAQVNALATPGRRVKVAFLARDAFLPMRIWNASAAGEAFYVEINRRVALVGGSERPEPLQDLFSMMRILDRPAVEGFLKAEIPAVTEFFAGQDDGMTTGGAFARELPRLLDDERMSEVSRAMRRGLLDYLRHAIDGFDDCTDLILVDLGYSGTIQRALRNIFDIESVDKRIHGVYLATVDDNFAQLPAGDSVSGFIDDTIMTPFSKRMVLRNIAVIEQCCSAPVGSILDYMGGAVRREADVRPRPMIERAFDVQEACVAFADAYRTAAREAGIDPLDGGEASRIWAAAMLSRFLMLPTREERQFFGPLLQDVNLGSRSLVPMIDGGYIEAMMGTLPLPMVCAAREPPMWLGGSIGEVLPMAGYVYAMVGEGLAPLDLLGDDALGPVSVAIVKDGRATPVTVEATLTGFGDIRLRVPIPLSHQNGQVALALDNYLARGVIKTLMVQRGADVGSALLAGAMEPIALTELRGLRAKLNEHHFRADGTNPYLLIPVADGKEAVAVLTITVSPLFVGAPPEDGSESQPLAVAARS